jgi:cobalt-zinc-cadmium efflux system outer membrane protein
LLGSLSGASPSTPVPTESRPSPELPSPLRLRDAIEIFRERGFDLLIAEATVRSAEGDLAIAGAIPNPGISLGFGKNFNCSSSQDCSVFSYGIGVSDQAAISTLVIGKIGLRREFAEAALEAARRSRLDARRTLEFLLKQAFVQALLAHAQLKNAIETRASNARTRELNERRFALGAISEADLATTQVAALEAEQAADSAALADRSARVALAFLLGFRTLVPDYAVDGSELDFRVPESLRGVEREDLLRRALQDRPDIRAQIEQEHRANAGLSLAHRNVWPDFALSFNYSANGGGETNVSPPNFSLGLSFSLPLFYFQGGEIRKAEADVTIQHLTRLKLEAQVVSDVENAWTSLTVSRGLVERMQRSLLERARTARDIIQIQYEKGAASLLDLLNAQRTYTATENEYALDLAGYWTAVAQLEQATAAEYIQ